jgi:GNAT superfamily N-acetyltransferase
VAGCAGPRIKPVGQEKSKQMHRDNHAIPIDRVHIHEIDALLILYVDLFHDREPLTKCIGFGKERMISIVRTMHADSNDNVLSRGLCWIARDRAEANRDVGFIVCDDPAIAGAQRMPDNLADDEAEKVSVVASLLEEVRDPVKDRLALEPGTCLHVSAVGVAPEYEGTGIAKRFLQTALSDARTRGFLYAFAECTSPASRMLHENFGFNSLRSVSVSDFVADRKFSFTNCDIDIHLMWMIFDEGKSR